MPLTTQQQINIGRLCGLYASNEIASGQKKGGLIDPRLPNLIYAVTQALVWMDELDSETVDLNIVGNYLISICRHQLKAQGVLEITSGGEVAPISGSIPTINDLDFIVSATSYISTGESVVTFDGTNGLPDLRGYSIDFFRSGQPMYTATPPDGRLYYSWNKVTGQFQLLSTDITVDPSAQVDEQFRIKLHSTSSTSSSTATEWRRLVISSSSFEPDGVTCNLATIVGSTYTLTVIGFNQEPQFAGTFFDYTSTGFEIIWPGFDAADFGNIIIDKID